MSKRATVFIIASLIFLVATMFSVQAAAPPVDPLHQVLYLKFENNSLLGENDTFVADLSGTQFVDNSTIENETWGNFTGHTGNNFIVQNATFNATSGYYGDGSFMFTNLERPMKLVNPTDGSFNFSTNFTVSFWVKTYNDENRVQGFFSQEQGSGYSNSPIDFAEGGDQKPSSTMYYNTTNNVFTRCNTPLLTLNAYNHFVVRGNGTDVTIFLNGASCASTAIPAGVTRFSNNGGNWHIGVSKTAMSPTRGLNGTLDDLIIWNNYYLTDNKIKQMYNDYVGILECTNDPTNVTNATSAGCEVRAITPTNWTSLNFIMSGATTLWRTLNIINSNVTFNNSNQIGAITGQNSNLNISGSRLNWTSSSAVTSTINLDSSGGQLNIENSILSGFYNLQVGINTLRVSITNSLLQNSGHGWAWFLSSNISVVNSSFQSASGFYEGLKFKSYQNDTDWLIINSTFNNSIYSCVFVYPSSGYHADGFTFTGNRVTNCGGHGVAYSNVRNTYVAYNVFDNITGYAVDAYGEPFGCENQLAEYNNVTRAGNGIIFSCGGGGVGGSFNTTSRYNRMINMTKGYAVYFNTITNGTSIGDYVEGGNPARCLGVVNDNYNIQAYNLTCKNLPDNGVLFGQSYNSFVDNVNLTNVSTDFVFANDQNITIRNSPINTGENLYGTASNEINLNFSNIGGKYFFAADIRSMTFNLTNEYYYFKNNNATGSQTVVLSNLSDAMAVFSDGQVITDMTGSATLTMDASEGLYVYTSLNPAGKLSGNGRIKIGGANAHYVIKS